MARSGSHEPPTYVPTARQLDILAHIEQRLSIKEIAARLDISESAVNKHIRTLKVQIGVNSQRELTGYYRGLTTPTLQPDMAPGTRDEGGYRETACRKNELFEMVEPVQSPGTSNDPSVAVMHDVASPGWNASWSFEREVLVAPRVLNGRNAPWVRGAALAVMVIGLFVAIIVGLGAAQAISLAMDTDAPGSRP